MKQINLLKVIILVLGLSFLGISLNAQDFNGMKCKMAEKLKLTDSQKEELRKLDDTHSKTMIDLQAQLKKLEIDLRSAWDDANLNKKDIDSQIDKISEVKTKIAKEKTNHWFNLYAKLDDNQKKEFKLMRPKLMDKMDKMKNKRMGEERKFMMEHKKMLPPQPPPGPEMTK